MSRSRIGRPGPAALLALAILAGCSERAKPAVGRILVAGGPLATSERGTTATFEVTLASAPSAWVVVSVLSEDASEGMLLGPTSAAPAAWISLSFSPSDWSTPQAVTVQGVDDAVKDGDVAYDIRLFVAGSDDPAYASAPDATVRVVNHDDDTPAILLSRRSLAVSETGARWDSFGVVLATQPSALVTVPVESGDPTEGLLDGGPQWIAPVGHVDLVFTPSSWSTPQRVTVTGQPDFIVDGDQAWAVTVGPATGAAEYAALARQTVAVVTADTDVAGLVLSTRALSLSEWSNASFFVRLSTIPAGPVVVPITSGDPTEAVLATTTANGLATATLTFDASSWDVDQEVLVQGVADFTVDGPKLVPIRVGPPSGDPAYAALPATTIDATVLDSDQPGIGYGVPGFGIIQTSEAGGTTTVWISLWSAPEADVLVPVTSNDPAEALVSAGGAPPAPSVTLRFTPTDWRTEQPVVVSGVDDAILELGPPHPFTISVGPTSSTSPLYDGVAGHTLAGTNADDEVAPNQGTAASPVEVTGRLPFSGTAGKGSSFYRVTGFPDGGLVGLRESIDWAILTVWDESPVPVQLCAPPLSVGAPTACAVRLPSGGSFIVQVDGSRSTRGSSFTLDVAPFTFATGLPLAMPAGMTWVSSSVTLSGAPAPYARIALSVDVDVGPTLVSSPFQVFLSAPGNGTVYQVVAGYTGGPGLGMDRTVLDEAAPVSVISFPPVLPPYAGTYRPAVPFPHPVDANGTWTLWVYGEQELTLARWGLAAR